MQCSTKSLLPPSLSSKSNPTSISILIILQTHNFFLLLSKDLLYIKNYPSSTDFKVINKLFLVCELFILLLLLKQHISPLFLLLCVFPFCSDSAVLLCYLRIFHALMSGKFIAFLIKIEAEEEKWETLQIENVFLFAG